MNTMCRPFLEELPDFVVIDFETADLSKDSACAVALVRVEEGEIVQSVKALIRPPRETFCWSHLHGITWDDVEDCPTFGERWQQLQPFLEGAAFLVAHHATFDREVLKTCCVQADLQAPALEFVCSMKLARKVWGTKKADLVTLCKQLHIPLMHHDPLSDALACATIFTKAFEKAPWLARQYLPT